MRLIKIGKKYAETYFRLKVGKSARFPLIVFLELTRSCNLKCKSCDVWRENKKKDMDITTVKRVLKECNESLLIHLIGGEVTLRPDLPDILLYSRKLNQNISFTTNGTNLTKELVRKLKKAGLNTITISLDSHLPHIHDGLRGKKGTFNKVIQGIENVRRANIDMIINVVVSNQNIHDLPESIGYFAQQGAKAIHLMPVLNVFPLNNKQKQDKDLFFTNKEYQILKQKIKEINTELVRFGYPKDTYLQDYPEFLKGKQHHCQRGRTGIEIDQEGNVYPCLESEIIVGNINERSLTEIWNSDRFKDIRNQLKECNRCYSNCHIEPMNRFSFLKNMIQIRTVLSELKLYR